MKPQRIIARNQVKLVGEQLSGLAREQLTVTFSESPANGSVDATAVSSSQVNGLLEQVQKDPPVYHFDADTLEATMVVTEGSSGKLSNVWLKGGVSVDHTAVDQEQSLMRQATYFEQKPDFRLSGRSAFLENPLWL